MKNIYIAGPWVARDHARRIAALLADEGHAITHPWWDYEAGNEDHERLAELATLDIEAVLRADVLVVVHPDILSEGKAWEQGLAWAAQIPIFVLGQKPLPVKCIFHELPSYRWFDDLARLRDALRLQT